MSRTSRGFIVAAAVTACAVACAIAAHAQPETPTKDAGPPPLPVMVQWHTTPSGLQYAEVKTGSGASPKDGQIAIVQFIGWLDNGTQFDDSHKRDKPFGFPLGSGQVIKGWDEGVRGMRAGGTRRLVIPPALGYGHAGVPGLVPPDATLIFDIELLQVVNK